jgi:ABC-type branched-subunit amino acid transport system substrate-binding protein
MRSARVCVAAVSLATIVVACHAFDDIDTCAKDTDCPRGVLCATEGYCRTGGPIPVGLMSDFTGSDAEFTRTRLRGLEFGRWIVERDPSLRPLGRGLTFVTADTLGDVEQVPSATSALLRRNVAAVIGPSRSSEVLAAQEITYPLGVLHIAPQAGADAIGEAQPEGDRYLFQLISDTRSTMPALSLFLARTAPPSYDVCFDGMALVLRDDAVGTSTLAALQDDLPRNCIPITAEVAVPTTKKNSYDAEVAVLLAAERKGVPTRCLFVYTPPDVAGEILRALEAASPPTRPAYSAFIGHGALQHESFFDLAKSAVPGKASLAEGFYGFNPGTSPTSAEEQDLGALWSQYLDEHPEVDPAPPLEQVTTFAEAVILLALAFELAGRTDDPVAVRDAFLEVARASTGDITFGPLETASAISRIRAARGEGRRAVLDYRGTKSFDFDERGFCTSGGYVWRARNGTIERVTDYTEEEMITARDANPGPACASR